jgi:hypothetical protein
MPGSNAQQSHRKARWRFWLRLIVVLFALYIVGYFPLMDRSRPTAFGEKKDFQSSFRWAGPMPDKLGRPMKFPDTTIWNIIYEPMDKAYFRLFSRSEAELDKLRDYGYVIWELRR